MRILVYGDSNSWGYLDDGSGIRHPERWPVVMARHLRQAGTEAALVEGLQFVDRLAAHMRGGH